MNTDALDDAGSKVSHQSTVLFLRPFGALYRAFGKLQWVDRLGKKIK